MDFPKSTVLNAAGSVATIASGFLTTVIVARMLGPEAVGIVAYAAFIVALSLAILDMGLPGTLTRFLPELEAEGREQQAAALTRTLFVPYLVFSALYSMGLFLLLDPGAFHLPGTSSLGSMTVLLIAAAVFIQSLAMFFYGALKGQRRFPLFAKIALVSALLQLVVAWTGTLLFGIAGALAAPVAGFLIAALLSLRSLTFPSSVDLALRKRAVKFAWQTWGAYFLTTVAWSRMEIYFLKHSWGDHAAGLFSAGLNLANLAFQFPMLLTGALVPFLVLKSKSDDSQAFAKSYGDGLRYFAMLVFPACLGAAAITPALLPFLYGPSFAEAVVPAMILIAGCCAMPFIAITQQYAMAVERTGMVLWLTALGAALSILSGLTLTPLYGTDGAAIGRIVAQATVAAAMLVYARRLGWAIPYRALWRLLAASALCAGVAGMVIYGISGGAGIAAAIVAAAIAYILLIGWLRILSEADYLMLARLPVGANAAALITRWSRLWHSSAARQPPLPSGLRVKSHEDV